MKILILYFFHGLGILVIFFGSLLGLAFITKDSLTLSIMGAVFITSLLAIIVYLMIQEKGIEENNGITLIEKVAYILYTTVTVISFFIVTHFINVNFILKSDIISSSKKKLQKNQDIFKEYKEQVKGTIDIIDTELRNAIKIGGVERERVFSMNGVDPSKIYSYDKERRRILRINEERAMQDFVSMEQSFLNFKQKKIGELKNPNPFKLYRAILEIDDEYDKTLTILESHFKASEENKAWNKFSFEYQIFPRQVSLVENPLKLMKKYQPSIILPLVGILVVHLFILMIYLFKKRNGTRRIYRPELKEKVETVY